MIALALILAAFVLIAAGVSAKRNGDRVIAEILGGVQRRIARERARGLDANLKARWTS